jgi:carnitine O-palmitoyltransferase 1
MIFINFIHIRSTFLRYLQSIHPLVSEDEYQRISTLAREFVSSDGPRLQKYLVLKSWWADNYISDWWEQYVYLKGRTSLMINSNYYALPSRSYIPSKNPLARAASLTYQLMLLKQKLDREQLPPLMLRNLVPMCMQQYTRIFSTTRIPGREEDQLKKYDTSKHIAVSCKGRWFKMPLFRKGTHGALLSAYDMQRQFESIAAAAAQGKAVVDEHDLALLTTANRTMWASHRDTFFSEGVNKKSLHVIESAIFVVILDETTPESVDDIGRSLIHGSGSNRWFDKSFNLVIFAHGKAGLNVEHSWADAPVVAHVWEEVLSREIIDRTFDAAGHCKKIESFSESTTSVTNAVTTRLNVPLLPVVEQLQWQWSSALQLAIDTERVLALKAIGDFDLRVISHTAFGKAAITKQCKMSPDAFIQLALQYAYYKNSHGTFTQTYEASMTRLYKHGRTETVRPVTDASKAFILSLVNPKIDQKTRRELGWAAGEAHQDLYRKAMSGQGVDRHLFTLYCVSVGMGIESSFLKDALQRPWRLSTSQQPQQQTTYGKTLATIIDDMESFWCPGGGFGPVAEDGYGVSYMIAGDSNLFFHISSNLSAPATSSTKFADDLFEALKEIRAVWEDEK